MWTKFSRVELFILFVLAIIVGLVPIMNSGCAKTTPATQPSSGTVTPAPAPSAYDIAAGVAKTAESIADSLAALGLIPQIDVSLAEAGVNSALSLWQQAIHPPVGAALDPLAETDAEAKYHDALARLESLNAQGTKAKLEKARTSHKPAQ